MAENISDKKVRNRGANFTNAEKQNLLLIVDKYRSIVESKKSDSVSNKQKLQAWEEICRAFNAKNISPEYRPAHRIKFLWDNIKRDTRRKLSALRQETFKKEGGRNPAKEELFCLKVKEIIGNAAEPMENNANDDGAFSVYTDQGTGSLGKPDDTKQMEVKEEVSATAESRTNVVEIAETSEKNKTLSNVAEQDKDWSHWKPIMLKTQKMSSLWMQSNSSSSSASNPVEVDVPPSAATLSNTKQAKELQHLDEIVAKRFRKNPCNNSCAKYFRSNKALIQAKIDYINTLKKEMVEKAALEKEILKHTLIETKLKIQILRKQLENGK
ncbi:uncharacterized protein LOC117169435 [Belonocnema kinseyi]|uniref:uncharacterized protein LOC117169435 n=1 Tax=Belonocnema kinseyi TaxID=2817044 RepID=UPI00143D35CE|nr:uncharacterized protein LOC117169435 [Belonocnema kinseyi]